MINNYFLVALRNLVQNKLYSAINIGGLAVGLASCLLIFLFVKDEMSYDKWIPNAENIYRVNMTSMRPGRPPDASAENAWPVHDAILQEFPQIEEAARLVDLDHVVRQGENINRERIIHAEDNFFRIFELPLLEGDPETALSDYTSIILSEKMAAKYFGSQPALGKVFTVDDKKDYKVVGIFKNLPQNSHMVFDFLVRVEDPMFPGWNPGWGSRFLYLYVKLKQGTLPETLSDRFAAMVNKYVDRENPPVLTLQNIRDIHLDPNLSNDMKTGGSRVAVYTFSGIAVLILFIAGINFVNLSTARSSLRAQEVCLRKVMGASRGHLIFQFLGEAIFMILIAVLIALALVELVFPWYNAFVDKQLALDYFGDRYLLATISALIVVISLLGGLYPAVLLSSFRPAAILKANSSSQGGGSQGLQSALVILQFTVSITLVICTAVISSQVDYMGNKDLGFAKENKLVMKGSGYNGFPATKTQALVTEISSLRDVETVAFSFEVPAGTSGRTNDIRFLDKMGSQNQIAMSYLKVAKGYFQTYDVPLLAGRDFSRDRSQDELVVPNDPTTPLRRASVILNQSAMRKMGYSRPADILGQVIQIPVRVDGAEGGTWNELEVIGVVPDMHFLSLHEKVKPFIFINQKNGFRHLTVKYRPEANIPLLTSDLGKAWARIFPDSPAIMSFLDDDIDKQYEGDTKMATLMATFTGLAIVISCLGLYAMASFTTDRRTREIGIRKVMGASVLDIIRLLVWQFSKPVLIANIIAWPVAYLLMQDYLNGFQYRIDLGPGTFITASVLTLLIAWATVTWHAAKVASTKPITALRYE
ncbi:MAG: hypothetical protein COB54_03050 [Alphaproteobacteria bacterium]|nr:MAG: hypothetical protein COB54_03050 [Alphaproteobacteria bacterium]